MESSHAAAVAHSTSKAANQMKPESFVWPSRKCTDGGGGDNGQEEMGGTFHIHSCCSCSSFEKKFMEETSE